MKKFPENFDALQNDFSRASLALPLPQDLSKQINRNRWALYASSLPLRQLVGEFAEGIDTMNRKLKDAPYAFDFSDKSEGFRAEMYSYILANETLAQQVCQRLRIEGAYDVRRPVSRIVAACNGLVEFDDDDSVTRQEWVERFAKGNLLLQNTSMIMMQDKIRKDNKLFKRMAYFIP
tara:strand:+ start:297 stop:827 length:531 start_codon:yes stop_codon:yes gene_type:complete